MSIAAAFMVVLWVALAKVPVAWNEDCGDSRYFQFTGLQILDGAKPYRDFWDVKPPGIFYLAALGGLLSETSLVQFALLDGLFNLLGQCRIPRFRATVCVSARGSPTAPRLRWIGSNCPPWQSRMRRVIWTSEAFREAMGTRPRFVVSGARTPAGRAADILEHSAIRVFACREWVVWRRLDAPLTEPRPAPATPRPVSSAKRRPAERLRRTDHNPSATGSVALPAGGTGIPRTER